MLYGEITSKIAVSDGKRHELIIEQALDPRYSHFIPFSTYGAIPDKDIGVNSENLPKQL